MDHIGFSRASCTAAHIQQMGEKATAGVHPKPVVRFLQSL